MDDAVRKYLSDIGHRGGRKSHGILDPDTARRTVAGREVRQVVLRFHPSRFRAYSPDLEIGKDDVTWVAEQLINHGDREAWRIRPSLCP